MHFAPCNLKAVSNCFLSPGDQLQQCFCFFYYCKTRGNVRESEIMQWFKICNQKAFSLTHGFINRFDIVAYVECLALRPYDRRIVEESRLMPIWHNPFATL